jgi:hypothetical protein
LNSGYDEAESRFDFFLEGVESFNQSNLVLADSLEARDEKYYDEP